MTKKVTELRVWQVPIIQRLLRIYLGQLTPLFVLLKGLGVAKSCLGTYLSVVVKTKGPEGRI